MLSTDLAKVLLDVAQYPLHIRPLFLLQGFSFLCVPGLFITGVIWSFRLLIAGLSHVH